MASWRTAGSASPADLLQLGPGAFDLFLGKHQKLVGLYRGQAFALPVGPLDFYGNGCFLTEAEYPREVALGTVTPPARHTLGLLADRDQRADGRPNAKPVIRVAAVVAIEFGRAAVRSYQNVEVAIVVEIGIGGSASYQGLGKGIRILKASLAEVAEEERDLRVLHFALHAIDLFVDMAVGEE